MVMQIKLASLGSCSSSGRDGCSGSCSGSVSGNGSGNFSSSGRHPDGCRLSGRSIGNVSCSCSGCRIGGDSCDDGSVSCRGSSSSRDQWLWWKY